MSAPVFLSICIPTYNRAELLAQTLNSIISQARDDIEIVVSDDASTDDTESVVRRARKYFPGIIYHKCKSNIGMDRNILKVVELAHGKFCWLLGDDDQPADGALAHLIDNYLFRKNIDFCLLAYQVYDPTLTHIRFSSTDELKAAVDIYTNDINSFFEKFFCESCLSAFVVNRNKWLAIAAEKYIGTHLVHLPIVYEYLAGDNHAQWVAKPLVKYRSGASWWWPKSIDIVIGQMNYVMDNLPVFYADSKPRAYKAYKARTHIGLKMLVYLRLDSGYGIAQHNKYIAGYYSGDLLKQFIALAIAISPPIMIRKAISAWGVIRSITSFDKKQCVELK